MSSILRALKKIETEAPQQDESQPWPKRIDTKRAVNSRVKKAWLVNRLFSALIVIIIVFAAGWLIFSQRQFIFAKFFPGNASVVSEQEPSISKESSPVFHAKIKDPKALPKKTPQDNISSSVRPSGKTSIEKHSMKSDTDQRLADLPALGTQKQPHKPSKGLALQNKRPPKTSRIPNKKNQQPNSAAQPNAAGGDAKSNGISSPKSKKSAAQDNFSSLKRINDSNLKLQAIAWSDDASRRLAVINNHIVREGESVDGFSVTQIRQEDVVVNDGTESWRLEFGLK